jgi:CRISPR-associated protein Csh2
MDYDTERNLVSDVRLKRYLRDYWLAKGEDVWVRRVEESGEEKTVTASQRIDQLAKEFGSKSAKEARKDPQFRKWLLAKLRDIRLFGATIPIGEEGARGASITLTGPVQFSWGYSLHPVEILPSSMITSTFAGREVGEKGEYGTMGKDWRVKYSLIAFYGLISAWRAEKTNLTESDVTDLDNALLMALPLQATTRSKIGQTPRLLIRAEYVNGETLLGDFRDYIDLQLKSNGYAAQLDDLELDATKLANLLKESERKIQVAHVWAHPNLFWKDGKTLSSLLRQSLGDGRVKELPHKEA